METEKLIRSETIYSGKILDLRIDSIELPSGRKTIREIVQHRDSVAIIPVDDAENVFLVRQYRSPLRQMLLEIPAGKTEPGESPLETAHRELIEETRYSAGEMEDLGGIYLGPGYSTEFLHLYYATDLKLTENALDDDEIAQVLHVPLDQIPEMITSGEICDAKSVAGLLRVIYNIK